MLHAVARRAAAKIVLVLVLCLIGGLAVGVVARALGSDEEILGPRQLPDAERILITGDSITQGSSGDYTWRYRLWNKLAVTAPGAVSFVGPRTSLYDVVNNSYGSLHYAADFPAKAHGALWGDSFVNELDKIGPQVSATDADVLVVMLGSNDLTYQTSPAATADNLRSYITRARAARPGIDVVVGEVLDKFDPFAKKLVLTTRVNQYASYLAALARRLDTSAERVVVAPTRTGWDPAEHTWDGTHPNATGESVIAQRVSEALAQIGVGAIEPDISGPTSWAVPGPRVRLTAGSAGVGLAWNRTSTGATGMYIEQRLAADEPWQRLQYAVAGDGWTAGDLAAGETYQYRLVPLKGSSTGVAGSASTVTVPGTRDPTGGGRTIPPG